MLKVIEGEVSFHMETSPLFETRIAAGSQQAIPPKVPYKVVPVGPIRLVVEFWGRPKTIAARALR